MTGMATAIGYLLHGQVDPANLIMIYLAGVAIVASRFGRGESVLCSVLSVLAFDFLFVPPHGSLAVSNSQYLLTFVVMLGVALLISDLTQRVNERERRTSALYTLSREMSQSRSKRGIAAAAIKQIREVFDADSAVMLAEAGLESIGVSRTGFERGDKELEAAQWSLTHSEGAGKGTPVHSDASGLYLPLRGSQGTVGVLAVLPPNPFSSAQQTLLETFANGLAMGMERAVLAKESHEARLDAESERMRNALLSSISHDLRTPLTAIAGAASSLQSGRGDVKELGTTIYEESMRLNIQVQNLLDMTRLQSGEVNPRVEWNSVEEIVGNALAHAKELLHGREVHVNLRADLPLVLVDGQLIEKVLLNLLENVSTHTPAGSPVEISVDDMREKIRINVADHGPGIPKGEEAKVFERFFRREIKSEGQGFGLGLAICRVIMTLHKGLIWVENRPDPPGALFHIEIPKADKQPEVHPFEPG